MTRRRRHHIGAGASRQVGARRPALRPPPLHALLLYCLCLWCGLVVPGVSGTENVALADKTFTIDASTDIRKIFKCSRVRPIGYYNEYYVACELHVPDQDALTELEIRDARLDGSALAPTESIHTELSFQLSETLTTVRIRNSSLLASGVDIRAAAITMDADSAVNTSARGFKFGPGYNSWLGMGGSYAGIGGASLTMMHPTCEDIPANTFFHPIGDVSGDLANFRGYGSGGGSDDTRGGGRIVLKVNSSAHINGSLLAVGANACYDCSESAGSGGTIIVTAVGKLIGSIIVKANGGEPRKYDTRSEEGGGGGGGGGRIVFDAEKGEEFEPSTVEAYGGGSTVNAVGNSVVEWCQLGADGTILKRRHDVKNGDGDNGDDPPTVSTLLVKGNRLAHAGPAKRIQIYGCTTIYERTSRDEPFLPGHLANLFVTGGASACATTLQLKNNVSSVISSIVLDSGSQLNSLDRDQPVSVAASKLMIQGYVGPSSLSDRDLVDVKLHGAEVTFSNAFVMVHELEVSSDGSTTVDQYTEIKFRERLALQNRGDIKVQGFLQPMGGSSWTIVEDWDIVAQVEISTQAGVDFRPQPVQLGAAAFHIVAGKTVTVNMPFDTPFLNLHVSAQNVMLLNVNSGPVPKCDSIECHADATACETLNKTTVHAKLPYSIGVFASDRIQIGNASAGSMILCGTNAIELEGSLSSDSLGCTSGIGPGRSDVVGDASGGAGHGGRGGNVLPGRSGGGVAYDVPTTLWEPHLSEPVLMSREDKWPSWPGSGASSGDTPSKVTGGSGGGLIHIGTTRLSVAKGASISARGEGGVHGGGGGAGGAIVISTFELSGGGEIDVSGGNATTSVSLLALASDTVNSSSIWHPLPDDDLSTKTDDDQGKFGGGGGGGVLRVLYQDVKDHSSGGERFAKDGGKLSISGGTSNGGENGGVGVAVGSNCESGRGGALCLPCPTGSHSPGRFSKCAPCDPGTFSNLTGADKCTPCPTGHFTHDFGQKTCAPCPIGAFAAQTGLKECKLCLPGTFASITGCSKCADCPIGMVTTASGSANCSVCGIGETTLRSGATECHACRHKPAHAAFNVHGNCSYACEKGRTGLDCLTPFERLIKPIGGLLGFLVLVFSITGLIFGSWGIISYRSNREKSRRYDEYKAQRLRDEQSLQSLTRHLTPRLTDQDLTAHVARLYLDGDNRLRGPWRLNPYFLPARMRDVVEEGTFASFAEECNKLLWWDPAGWEAWVFRLALCLVPPLSIFFMRKRQLSRVERLSKYIVTYGGRFFREMNFRVHAAKMKLGFSPDFSLAYLDVLMASGSTISRADPMDLVLVVGGSGSFFRPYHLDTNDLLVRAVPAQLELLQHSFWIEFVADANLLLRVLPQPSSRIRRVGEAVEVTRDIMFIVDEFNKQHHDDGFAVEFGTFSVGDPATGADSNAACFEPFETSSEKIEDIYHLYTVSPFKLAFRVSRLAVDDENGVPGSHVGTTPASPNHSFSDDTKLVENDPRPVEFRLSQIRMQALFASARPVDEIGDEDDRADRPLTSPKKAKMKRRRSSFALGQWVARVVGQGDNALSRLALTLWQPIYPLFRLRNFRPPRVTPRWVLPATMVLLLLADMAVAFWILMEYYCIQVGDPTAQDSGCSRAALWSVIGILPAAIIGTPALGLVFLTRKSVFYGKQFALWNVSSVVNLLVAFVCGLSFVNYIHEGVLLVIAVGVAVKYAEKQMALRCIAQYAAERPLRGWRGLSTTRDWYDAAYTPLVHHEN